MYDLCLSKSKRKLTIRIILYIPYHVHTKARTINMIPIIPDTNLSGDAYLLLILSKTTH